VGHSAAACFCPLKKLKWLIVSIATLHNFCINERIGEDNINQTQNNNASPLVLEEGAMLPTNDVNACNAFAELEYAAYQVSEELLVGVSDNQELIKRNIIALKLERPKGNHSKAC
jgi:hypothetical protein